MLRRKVAFHTLGCKLNFAETSSIARKFEQGGYEKVAFSDEADIFIINSCSVTENADKECRSLVRGIKRRQPQSMVVVTGCYAQLKPEQIISIEGVDMVLGAAEKFRILDFVENFAPGQRGEVHCCEIEEVGSFHGAISGGDRTRTFLKVQDGCDYSCTFCTIPAARGSSRSNSIAKVLEDIKSLKSQGVKEIILTGINLGDFGKGPEGARKHQESFHALLQAIEALRTGIRFRISSIEPNLLTDEIITLVANSESFVHHFHIPLQSGSDRILGLMKRRYRRELYSERIASILEKMPDAAIGVDVITGFPSETEDDFRETYEYLRSLKVSYLHVFSYSERSNTEAISIQPVVPVHTRKERTNRLRILSAKLQRQFYECYAGQEVEVLFEKTEQGGLMAGYSSNYLRVVHPYDASLVDKIVKVRLAAEVDSGQFSCILPQEESLTF